jgi:hypothetical protein
MARRLSHRSTHVKYSFHLPKLGFVRIGLHSYAAMAEPVPDARRRVGTATGCQPHENAVGVR